MHKRLFGSLLHKYMSEYISECTELNLSPKTQKSRKEVLFRYYAFLKCRQFTIKTAREYFSELTASGWKYTSVNCERKVIKSFLNFLERRKYIKADQNFTKEIQLARIKGDTEPESLPSMETAEQIILAGCEAGPGDNARNQAIKKEMELGLRFALRTGLRISELLSLKGKHLYPDSEVPSYHVMGKGGNWYLLPLPSDMVEAMRGRTDKARVFPITAETCNLVLKRGCKRLRVNYRITCHSLRKIFTTSTLSAGAPLAQTSKILRHTNPSLTLNVYSKFSCQDLAKTQNLYSPLVRKTLKASDKFEYIESIVKSAIENDGRLTMEVVKNETEIVIKVKEGR